MIIIILKLAKNESFGTILKKIDVYRYVTYPTENVREMFRYIYMRLINIRRATACLPNSEWLTRTKPKPSPFAEFHQQSFPSLHELAPYCRRWLVFGYG